MIFIKKSIVTMFIIISLCSACATKDTSTVDEANSVKETDVTPSEESSKLMVAEEDKTSFIYNNEVVKVSDETNSITSIMSLEWIDSDQIAIISHINPSLDYFTVYNVKTKEFTDSIYGTDFIWDKNDISTLIYLKNPSHFSDTSDKAYIIFNYAGDELYESKDQLTGLKFDGDQITFTIIDPSGNKTQKNISKM